jgi:hypothetical protein
MGVQHDHLAIEISEGAEAEIAVFENPGARNSSRIEARNQ